MEVTYNKLWHLLIDRGMKKKDLKEAAGLTSHAMMKLRNNEDMKGKIDYAQLLNDGSEIRFREEKDGSVNFIIPGIKPDVTVPALELFLKEEV